MVMEKVEAPFSSAQVQSLNDYQRAGFMHPFTCPQEHLNWWIEAPETAMIYVPEDAEVVSIADLVNADHLCLVAYTDGWHCPGQICDYTQNWAHEFMADDSWRESWAYQQHILRLEDEEDLPLAEGE